jgi:hypothetical protein
VREPTPVHKRPVRQHEQVEVPTVRLARPKLSAPGADAGAVAATELLSSSGASSGGSAALLLPVLVLALLVLVTSITPAEALPRQVDGLLDGRREMVAFTAGGVLLAVVLALLIAHAGP